MEENSNQLPKEEKIFKIFLIISAIILASLDFLREAIAFDFYEFDLKEFDTFLLLLVVLAILNPFVAVLVFIKSKNVLKRVVVSLFSLAVVSGLPFFLFGDVCGAQPYSYSNPLGFGECDPLLAEPTFDVFPFHFLIVYLAIISWVVYFFSIIKKKLNSIKQSSEGKKVEKFSWKKISIFLILIFAAVVVLEYFSVQERQGELAEMYSDPKLMSSSLSSNQVPLFDIFFEVFQWFFLLTILVGVVSVVISAVQRLSGKKEVAKKLFLRGITLVLVFSALYYLIVGIKCTISCCWCGL